MTSLYNQNRASLNNFTILTTHCIAQLSPSELSKSLIVICYKGDQEKGKNKNKKNLKNGCPVDFLDVLCISLYTRFSLLLHARSPYSSLQ